MEPHISISNSDMVNWANAKANGNMMGHWFTGVYSWPKVMESLKFWPGYGRRMKVRLLQLILKRIQKYAANLMASHPIVVETFYSNHRCQHNGGPRGKLRGSWQSVSPWISAPNFMAIRQFLRYFSLDQSGGTTDQNVQNVISVITSADHIYTSTPREKNKPSDSLRKCITQHSVQLICQWPLIIRSRCILSSSSTVKTWWVSLQSCSRVTIEWRVLLGFPGGWSFYKQGWDTHTEPNCAAT